MLRRAADWNPVYEPAQDSFTPQSRERGGDLFSVDFPILSLHSWQQSGSIEQ